MSYKTILVHVDTSEHAPARIRIAAAIAIAENAHLIGAAMSGISRFVYQDSAIDLTMTVVAAHLDALYQRANQALATFDAIAQELGVLSFERRLVDDDPEGGLCLQARYSDLVVVGQTDPDDPAAAVIADLPEYVTLNCGRPVLVVPYSGQFQQVGKNILIAWDGSREAVSAITGAIPLLRRADNVTLALFNPSTQFDAHGEQPGADLALYLARHGIKIDVATQHTKIEIGDALLSLAADLGSDLIVMGSYGHTRFREVLLGGVTKTVLKTMTVPVFMVH